MFSSILKKNDFELELHSAQLYTHSIYEYTMATWKRLDNLKMYCKKKIETAENKIRQEMGKLLTNLQFVSFSLSTDEKKISIWKLKKSSNMSNLKHFQCATKSKIIFFSKW